MVNLHDLELLKILPSSISDDKNIRAIAQALDPELQSVSRDTREALIISRIDELSEPVLDLLAWQWHVDFYEPDKLPVALKRALVRGSITWHRKKGTLWAVKQVLRDLGLEPTIREWWEIGTAPYTFAVEAGYKGDWEHITDFLGPGTEEMIRLAIEAAKPARAGLHYVVVIPDSPNIGLPPDHVCIYNVCFFNHGWWPRSVPVPGGGAVLPVPRAYAFGEDISYGRVAYLFGPTYGNFRFNELPHSVRVSPAVGMDSETRIVKIPRTRGYATVRTVSFAQAVFNDNEPVGSLNCVYSPRYRTIPPPIYYNNTRFNDYIEQPQWRSIDRYYEDISLRKIEAGPSEIFMLLWNETVNKIIFPSTTVIQGSSFFEYTSLVHLPRGGWGGPWGGRWGANGAWRTPAATVTDDFKLLVTLEEPEVKAPMAEDACILLAEGNFATDLPPVSVTEEMVSRVNAYKAGWAGPWGGKWSPDIRRVRAVIIVDEEE
jgi:hypothetical protein